MFVGSQAKRCLQFGNSFLLLNALETAFVVVNDVFRLFSSLYLPQPIFRRVMKLGRQNYPLARLDFLRTFGSAGAANDKKYGKH